MDRYPGGFTQGTILFSIDAVNLYGNIPINEAIDASISLLDYHRESVETFRLDLAGVCELLEHYLTNNYVRFENMYFRQTEGIVIVAEWRHP